MFSFIVDLQENNWSGTETMCSWNYTVACLRCTAWRFPDVLLLPLFAVRISTLRPHLFRSWLTDLCCYQICTLGNGGAGRRGRGGGAYPGQWTTTVDDIPIRLSDRRQIHSFTTMSFIVQLFVSALHRIVLYFSIILKSEQLWVKLLPCWSP